MTQSVLRCANGMVRWKAQPKPFREVFASPPVFDNIFDMVGPGDLLRLSRTSNVVLNAVETYIPHAFNINRHLMPYFSDPMGFRLLQAKTGTIISGSTALQFLDRTVYPNSDLDLYVTREHTFELGEWVMKEGYTYFPTNARPTFSFDDADLKPEQEFDTLTNYCLNSLCAVFEFRKGESKVQIIVAKYSTFHAIAAFHSTCVMNFITYEAAYSLYPRATFDARLALGVKKFTAKESRAAAKYSTRGWAITCDVNYPYSPERMKKLFAVDSNRWVLDRHTWHLPLAELDFPPRRYSKLSPEIDFDPIIPNGWLLTRDNKFTVSSKYLITSKVLKHGYMWAGEDFRWKVLEYLDRQSRLETRKFDLIKEEDERKELWSWWDVAMLTLFRAHFKE